jgi:hypothetical protein
LPIIILVFTHVNFPSENKKTIRQLADEFQCPAQAGKLTQLPEEIPLPQAGKLYLAVVCIKA